MSQITRRDSVATISGGGAPIVAGGAPPPPPSSAFSSQNLLIDGPSSFNFAHTSSFSGWLAMGVNWFNTNWGSSADCFYGCGQTATKWAAAPIADTTLSSGLSTGGAITTLAVNAVVGTIPTSSTIYVVQGTGGLNGGTNTQGWVTTAQANPGDVIIHVSSQTPNFAYASGSPVFYGYSLLQAQLVSVQAVANCHSVGGSCFLRVRLDTNGAFGTGDTVLAPWWDANWATGTAGVGTALYAGVYNLAAAAAALGFDGIFFDSEGYTTPGDQGWEWNYSGNAHTQAATNTQAQLDGQMFAQWLAAGWASAGTGTKPTVLVYLSAKAGMTGVVNNNGSPVTAGTQGTVEEASIFAVDGDSFTEVVTTWFWSGFVAANSAPGMPSSVCFITELLYRYNQQGLTPAAGGLVAANWNSLLTYQANTVIAALSQLAQAFNPTGWNYWATRVFSTGAAWIDGTGTAGDPVDSLAEVEVQLGNPAGAGTVGVFPAWCNPNQPTVLYQYGGGTSNFVPAPPGAVPPSGFDYSNGTRDGGGSGSPSGSDYRPAMLNTNTKYLVDSSPPTFGTFSPASGGSHVHGATTITGSIVPGAQGNPIASVTYSLNGGVVQGAALTLNLLSGPAIPPVEFGWTSPWVWNMQFSAAVVLVSGANSITFTVTTVSGLQTTYGYTLTGT